ncbi:MAG: glycosyltransferase family 1 protein, partial [Waddliaceae bacterium]|nr:glycosyltransferase family 1 protein [Waddliaceae bacterium]
MHILHTEASPGWGGQEIRILRESEGLRERGHDVIFIIQENGGLV